MLNIGFIGAGRVTRHHVATIKSRPDLFCLKAVADLSLESREYAKENYHLQNIYTNYQEMLKDKEIDAVLVAVPHDVHVPLCVDAFSAGKHVLVEKPIARTSEEADCIIKAAEKANKVLLVGHNERYMPQHAKIKEILDNKEIGPVFCARTDHFQNFSKPKGVWWRDAKKVGGGCVIGSGIHRLDLLLWYLGNAQEVYAYQSYLPERLEGEVASSAVIKFKSGAVAEFFCNWGVYSYPYGESLSISGKDGGVYCGIGTAGLLVSKKDVEQGAMIDIDCGKTENMWEHFEKCIYHGVKPLTSGQAGKKAIELVEAIYESAQTGKPVLLK